MRSALMVLLFITLSVIVTQLLVAPNPIGVSDLESPIYSEIYNPASSSFRLTNNSNSLAYYDLKSECSCTILEDTGFDLEPGESKVVRFSINSRAANRRRGDGTYVESAIAVSCKLSLDGKSFFRSVPVKARFDNSVSADPASLTCAGELFDESFEHQIPLEISRDVVDLKVVGRPSFCSTQRLSWKEGDSQGVLTFNVDAIDQLACVPSECTLEYRTLEGRSGKVSLPVRRETRRPIEPVPAIVTMSVGVPEKFAFQKTSASEMDVTVVSVSSSDKQVVVESTDDLLRYEVYAENAPEKDVSLQFDLCFRLGQKKVTHSLTVPVVVSDWYR